MREGNATRASLKHLAFRPRTAKLGNPIIVALHGRGANEHDLLPLLESLKLSDTLVVVPRAPFMFSGFPGAYAWYELGEEGMPDPKTFRTSIDLLRSFLRETKEAYAADPARFLLLGFSQGTVMAYAVGLLAPEQVRGIAALSGYVPHRSTLPLKLHDLNGLPVFISHGAWDEIIPVHFGRESAQLLTDAGADVVYREYPMGHEVREETLHDLTSWIRDLIDSNAPTSD